MVILTGGSIWAGTSVFVVENAVRRLWALLVSRWGVGQSWPRRWVAYAGCKGGDACAVRLVCRALAWWLGELWAIVCVLAHFYLAYRAPCNGDDLACKCPRIQLSINGRPVTMFVCCRPFPVFDIVVKPRWVPKPLTMFDDEKLIGD